MQQGNSVPQVNVQPNSQIQSLSQSTLDGLSSNSDQSTLKLGSNESPCSSPKHSPRQSHKNSKIENAVRDPSPFQPEKLDLEQQVRLFCW